MDRSILLTELGRFVQKYFFKGSTKLVAGGGICTPRRHGSSPHDLHAKQSGDRLAQLKSIGYLIKRHTYNRVADDFDMKIDGGQLPISILLGVRHRRGTHNRYHNLPTIHKNDYNLSLTRFWTVFRLIGVVFKVTQVTQETRGMVGNGGEVFW